MTQVTTGTLLAGKYRLEVLIGRGGMGSVWRAEHLGLNAPVAVKLLDMVDFSDSAEARNRFHREARAAAAIRSPHVVQILDHGVDPALGVPFIVMELMEGESLAQRLARSGRISAAEVARVFTHVARALSRAHEAGIVHRDLKPDNVFLVRNEDEEVAKVLDFGIAKAQGHGLGSDSATRTGAVMGTAYYMSPEQISGAKNVDFLTDLWAFGVMACECLTGRRPFDADTIGGLTLRICIEPVPVPSHFAPVPAGFDGWFARVVNRDPAQRFSSAREAADTLRQLCTGDPAGPWLSVPVPAPSGVVEASSATTGVPLSQSAGHFRGAVPPVRRASLPWVVGGGLAVAVAVGLWVRSRGNPLAEAAAPSASAPAAAAATSVSGTAANAARAVSLDSAPTLMPSAATSASSAPAVSPAPLVLPALHAVTPAHTHGPGKPPSHRLATTATPASSALVVPVVPVAAATATPPKPVKPAATARDLLDDR
ncbi:MAG: serine/threonine-protein kinase [Polyangiaceae bacterium]